MSYWHPRESFLSKHLIFFVCEMDMTCFSPSTSIRTAVDVLLAVILVGCVQEDSDQKQCGMCACTYFLPCQMPMHCFARAPVLASPQTGSIQMHESTQGPKTASGISETLRYNPVETISQFID